MSVEAQLRDLAEAAVAEQRPVTAEEVLARATDRYVFDVRPARPRWELVAATAALVVGGLVALLAWDRGSDEHLLPAVSIPDSVAPTTAAPSVAPVEVLVNEPTLDYRDGVEWWAPGQIPAGWQYGYADQDGETQTIRLFADDGSKIDIEFGGEPSSSDALTGDATIEELGGEAWQVLEAGLVRDVDGRLLAVRGPLATARVVAAQLRLVFETDLVRPPFRADAQPGPVVLTLPADEVGGAEPFELRAHTDGVYTTVGGEIKRVSAEDPLGFGDYIYELSGDTESYRVVMTGVAFAGLEQIRFGLLAGDDQEVAPTASERFAEDFFALVIDVPASVLEQYDQGELARLTRWTLTHVDGEQRVYDEPASANCVNCDDSFGSGQPGPVPPDRSGAPPLEFEPTNVYADQLWWIPTVVPDGYEFDSAIQGWGVEGDHTVVYRPIAGGGARDKLTVAQSAPVDSEELNPPTGEELIDGVLWSWSGDASRGELSRLVDGRRLSVHGDRQAAVAAAATLELVPESRLERPPFRYGDDLSTSVVVATAPGDTETELRASTDGVNVSLDGSQQWEPIASDEPLRLLGGGSSCGDDACEARLFGITSADVATVDIEQLDGEVITVVPEDLSGRFGGIGFFIVQLEVPSLDVFSSVIPSIVARNADGEIVAAISEPL